MGLLDNNNMEYFKNKVFGYPDPSDGYYDQYGNNQDDIYKRQHGIKQHNSYKSYWDMLRDGNFAGPFRQNFPLEQPEGFLKRFHEYNKLKDRATFK